MSRTAAPTASPSRFRRAFTVQSAWWILFALAVSLPLAHRRLPFVDWPEHLAQDAIVLHAHDPAFGTSAYYQTTGWFLPYQGFRTLHLALATVLPFDLAARIALALALALTALATRTLLARMHRDPGLSLASWLLLYDANVAWGFAPHALGTALLFTALVLAHDALTLARGLARRTVLLVLLGIALFFTHAQQTALFLASVPVLALASRASWQRRACVIGAAFPAGFLLVLYLAGRGWIDGTALRDDFAVPGGVRFDPPWRVVWNMAASSGLTAFGHLPLVAFVVVVALLVLGPRTSHAPRTHSHAPLDPLRALALLWAFLAFALPAVYRAQTLAPRVASLALLGLVWWPRRQFSPAIRAGFALCSLSVLALVHVRAVQYARAVAPLDGALAHIPPRSRVATLVYDTMLPGFALPVMLHADGYVLEARGGMAGFAFTRTGVTYAPDVPRESLLVQSLWRPASQGWQMDASRYAPAYDRVLVRTGWKYPGNPFTGDVRAWRIERVWEEGGFEVWSVTKRE